MSQVVQIGLSNMNQMKVLLNDDRFYTPNDLTEVSPSPQAPPASYQQRK